MDVALLNKAFRRLGLAGSASESHGVLCGLLCARGYIVQHDWVELMRGDFPAPEAAARSSSEAEPVALEADSLPAAGEWAAVSDLYEETVLQLRQADSILSPLLPDDTETLDVRSEAIADWCSGFLYGLGAGGIDDYAVLPEDVREIVGDIIEISRASSEPNEGDDDEAAYAELVEYLRAGVTLVFEILETERAVPAHDRIIH